jgi:hypothetical protein
MKATLTYDTEQHDLTPVRLRINRKAYILVPRDFYKEDVAAIKEWLDLYITPRLLAAPQDD